MEPKSLSTLFFSLGFLIFIVSVSFCVVVEMFDLKTSRVACWATRKHIVPKMRIGFDTCNKGLVCSRCGKTIRPDKGIH